MSMAKAMAWMGAALFLAVAAAQAQWLAVTNAQARIASVEMGGPVLALDYELQDVEASADGPAWVFITARWPGRPDWEALPAAWLRGNGHGLITSPGKKRSYAWGLSEHGWPEKAPPEIRIRALRMRRIPGGVFDQLSLPGGGRDAAYGEVGQARLSTFWMSRHEITVGQYVDYLNEVGGSGAGWNPSMTNAIRCGIERGAGGAYAAMPGRANHPVTYVSWYDAQAFLAWCGLRLPTEAEWEKALRGGHFLDGDDTRRQANPMPKRPFPWGIEPPNEGGVHRCNYEGDADGFAQTASVGSFAKFDSPYGISDLVGNVAEWTLDWYTTSYHAQLDGFRMIRGGSCLDPAEACDAVSGSTRLPIKESGITGFRGVWAGPQPPNGR